MEIDIFSIDKKIRDIWNNSNEKICLIEDEIKEMKDVIEQETISLHIVKDLSKKIKKLEEDKSRLENMVTIQHFYTMDVSELLESQSYVPNKISFMGKSRKPTNDVSKSYVDILKKYNIDYKELEDVTIRHTKKNKHWCDNCGRDEFVVQLDQNLEVCEYCGKQEEKTYKSLSYKDISRVNMSSKYTYERRIHFKDCINQYQGKQNSSIDDKVFNDLEEQFERHGLLNGDKSVPKKIRFDNVTKEHVLLFLKETNHAKYYEDIVLIFHKMTGKKVDDISHLENQLMEDFDKISNLYDKKFKFTGKVDRKSFINTQYVLFQLLRRHKYPCKKEDFNMLKTLDRKSFHDEIVRELFEHLNFNFTPIF